MASPRLSLEVTLESVALRETGAAAAAATRHLLTATLVWPRLAVARKSFSRPCRLVGGAAQFTAQDWCDAILFKETLEGRFALALSISEALSDERLDAFLRFFGHNAFAVASSLVDDWAGPVGKFAAVPLDFAAKQLGKSSEAPAVIAEGILPLDAADWTGRGPSFSLALPLTARHDITQLSRRRAPPGKRSRTVRTVRLAKGAPNGEVRLLCSVC